MQFGSIELPPLNIAALREQSKFGPGSTINVDTHNLKISLFNTRSLRRHAADNSKHKTLMKTDVNLC